MTSSFPILIAGATGYVSGRLIPELIEKGYRVRALGRNLEKLSSRPWAGHSQVELVKADVLDLNSLKKAVDGCRAAYYLVHSMIARGNQYVEADRQAAKNMAKAAADTGLERIIYLGGLAEARDKPLSKHLRSRIEVAEILRSGAVPTTVLRAPMILGSGSASFEILRYLVERLPIMTTPRWVRSLNQPIAIRNVIHYLTGCLEHEETTGQTFDIGGPDILTYQDLLDIYAEEAHLRKRIIIPVPVLTPTLSALWINLITPVPKSIALPLTEGLTSDAVCRDNRIQSIISQRLLSCREAIRLALERVKQAQVATCWTDAGDAVEPEWARCGDAVWAGGTILTSAYRVGLNADAEEVWHHVCRIGGDTGWYYGNFLWRMRGFLDQIIGGVGLRRGRRHPSEIRVGDALDFWRVLRIDPPRYMLLLAEMKVPGEALLEFNIVSMDAGKVELNIISKFLPRGLFGILYWYGVYPLHGRVFKGMLSAIAEAVGKPFVYHPKKIYSESS
ncbi:MAG: SDR family oxidoreductase [Desulfobacterales bacterium]